MIAALIPVLSSVIGKVAGNLFPDPADELKRQEVQNKFTVELLQQSQAIEQAAASIVKAEAESANWLTSSWRPITMMVFVALIVARWFGWAAPNLSEAEYLHLWDIVELGLGGYVIGRSAEKLVPKVTELLKK